MWIEEVKNSKGIRYKYCERFINPADGKPVKISITLKSDARIYRKQAREMLETRFTDKYITKANAAANQHAAKLEELTFSEVADEWFTGKQYKIKPSTINSYSNALKAIRKRLPIGLYFKNFTPAIASNIINDVYYKEKQSKSYANIILILIKAIMTYAQQANYIDDIAGFKKIRLEKRPATKEELSKAANKFLDRDELRECLNQLQKINKRVALMMEFIALTGLRIGELLALRVQDYDPVKSCISVNATMMTNLPNGNTEKRGTPKTNSSYRTIGLSVRACQILKIIIAENSAMTAWKKGAYKDRGYIFTSIYGYPYNYSRIALILEGVKIPSKHITTHIFRHTHISLLAEQGEPLKVIMDRVGHKSPNTTLKIYTHVTDKMKDDLVKRLNNIVI